ncbi:MAG: hypothetical protein PVH96_02435 [Gemmatimonadota bacterium]
MKSRPDAPHRAARSGSDSGAALAFVVLIMLALLTLAHGALLAALSEREGSRMAVRELRLRGAAEHALARTLSRRPGPALDSMNWWEVATEWSDTVGGMATGGVVRRLGPESWLVEGRALDPSGVEARSARLAWSLDPLTRVLMLRGVVTTTPGAAASIAGTVDASAPAMVRPPMQPGDCDPWQASLTEDLGGVPLSVVAPPEDSTAPLALGAMDFDRILAAAPVLIPERGTPAPDEALGACLVDEPWVWGDPDQPWRPCGPVVPMRASLGELEVEGGVGQALLVVDGDLSLTAGARYYGLVLVRGMLRLEGGAHFEGMALARDGVDVASSSSLVGSECWALRALAENRSALGGFVPVSDARIGPL